MNSLISTTSKRQPNKFLNYERLNKDLYKQLNPGVSFEEWKKIINQSNKQIGNYILNEPLGFLLPNRLGLLMVNKFKQKGYFNMKHFCQTGEKKPLLNLHSLGYLYKIRWIIQKNTIFSTRNIYKFKAVRVLNRTLASRIFAQQDIYHENSDVFDFTALC